MTPEPAKTKLEMAEVFDVSASIARDAADFVFAKECEQHAEKLREEHQQEIERELRKGNQ